MGSKKYPLGVSGCLMSEIEKDFFVVPPPGQAVVNGRNGELISPAPPSILQLSDEEMHLYEYICKSLRSAGVEHLTAGVSIVMIVRTFSDWISAAKKCEVDGRSQISKTGWATETPWAKDEARLKMELGQWLPKACLTIPSLARVRKDMGEQGKQDDLFSDLVNHGISSPEKNIQH